MGSDSTCSRSWSKRIFWRDRADEDEVALATAWADARLGGVGRALMLFEFDWCGGLDCRWGRGLELQEKACLDGHLTFGRVPQAKIADFMQALRQHMLEEAAHELVAL